MKKLYIANYRSEQALLDDVIPTMRANGCSSAQEWAYMKLLERTPEAGIYVASQFVPISLIGCGVARA